MFKCLAAGVKGSQKMSGGKHSVPSVYHALNVLLIFNACGCIHCTDTCMNKRTPPGNDYFAVFASCCDVLSMYSSEYTHTNPHKKRKPNQADPQMTR